MRENITFRVSNIYDTELLFLYDVEVSSTTVNELLKVIHDNYTNFCDDSFVEGSNYFFIGKETSLGSEGLVMNNWHPIYKHTSVWRKTGKFKERDFRPELRIVFDKLRPMRLKGGK